MFMKLSKTSSITLIADKNDNYFNTTYKFITKAKKYFTISKEEYAFLKSEVNRYLLSQKTSEIGIGVEIAKIFLPVKLIAQDIEMQKSLFNLMKNRNEYNNTNSRRKSSIRKAKSNRNLVKINDIEIDDFDYRDSEPDYRNNNRGRNRNRRSNDDSYYHNDYDSFDNSRHYRNEDISYDNDQYHKNRRRY